MLVVETFVAPSKIHGNGVFAKNNIPAGTQVWVFNPIIDCEITVSEIESLPPAARAVAIAHSFVESDGRVILSRDNAVFFNHSETPNTEDRGQGNIALRDIEAGEELTENYRNFNLGGCNIFLNQGSDKD